MCLERVLTQQVRKYRNPVPVLRRTRWGWAFNLGVSFLLLSSSQLTFGTIPIFHLVSQDRTKRPRCLLWHGWLPGLSSRTFGTSWAVVPGDLALHTFGTSFGSYPLKLGTSRCVGWDLADLEDMADSVPPLPTCGVTAVGMRPKSSTLQLLGLGSSLMPPHVCLIIVSWVTLRTMRATMIVVL